MADTEKEGIKGGWFAKRLARRLVLQVAALGLVLMLCMSAYQTWRIYQHRIGEVDRNLEQISRAHLNGIAAALASSDRVQLVSQAVGLINFPYFSYVAVREGGRNVFEAGRRLGGDMIVRTFTLFRTYRGGRVAVGSLYIEADRRQILRDILSGSGRIFFTQMVDFAFVGLLFFLIFERVVSRHLSAMAGYFRSLNIGGIAEPLRLHKKYYGDELDTMADSFNRMRKTLDAEHRSLLSAQRQLRESEGRYSDLYENAPDMYFSLDVNSGVIMHCNETLLRATGYAREEVVGCPVFDFYEAGSAEASKDSLKGFVFRGEIWNEERTVRCKDGRLLGVILNATAVRDDAGKILYSRSVWRDVTGLKRVEEEKKKLEARIAHTDKVEAIGTLAGGIAHDFNNLLGGIFGYIERARDQAAAGNYEKISPYLEKAAGVFDRARSLTKQLLTFSKGGAPLKKVTRLGPLVEEAVHFALSGSNVKAEIAIATDLWNCEVDANQISEVLNNIVINARQAMPGGGTIQVAAENLSSLEPPAPLKPGAYALITVRDQGVGIPPEHLSRLFVPFFTTKQKGSGLGLASAYSIVSKHEGLIAVESELNRGTTVRIYLPAAPAALDKPAPQRQGLHQGCGRVLLMDDEAYLRDIAVEIFAALGYESECAADGAEAIEKFKEARAKARPFDMVILDLTVPGGMGGEETVRALKAIDPQVKAIATSGYSDNSIMANPGAFGFLDSLTKPYIVGELSDVLRRTAAGDLNRGKPA